MLPNTTRISFRRFTSQDLPLVFRLHSDPRVMKYIEKPRDLPQAKSDLERYINYYSLHPGYGYWPAFEKEGTFMGWFTVKKLPETQECELGYRLLPEYWGQGLATEGAGACIDYAFNHLGVPYVVAVALPENKASCRVLEKVGFNFQKIDEFYKCQCAYYRLNSPHG